MAPAPIPLPLGITLSFFAEGAANIVYRISASTSSESTPPANSEHEIYGESTPPPSEIEFPSSAVSNLPIAFRNKLLRLRKDLPNTTPILEAQTAFEEVIQPLFKPDQLVEQILIKIPDGLLGQLNAELRAMEGSGRRKEGRSGVFLDEDEDYGVLVTDMSPSGYEGGRQCICVEFKPKWLAISPSAPEGATRCRTCALRAMREANGIGTEGALCPLDLVGSRADMSRATDSFLKAKWGKKPEERLRGIECWIRDRIGDHIWGGDLLRTLCYLQIRFEGKGMFGGKVEERDFLTAMTLRDCTLYLRIPVGYEPLEARLGDLDLKSPAKASSWIAQERQLIEEGWYMGNEKNSAQSDVLCALQRAPQPKVGTVKTNVVSKQKTKPNPRKRQASPSDG